MKITAPYRCDYCTNTKGEANHWWLRPTEARFRFALLPWSDRLAGASAVEHICSEACAIKALAKWMGEQKPIQLREDQ